MRVGVYCDLRNPPGWRRPWSDHYARTLELIEGAEAAGAGSVWLTEHHMFEDGYLPQPMVMAAAIAARTRHVRIGTAVLLAPLRSPLHLAEEAALVDLISGGRLELGLGTGYLRNEFEAFGVNYEDRFAALERCVHELRDAWTGGRVTPPPAQADLPLWCGFSGPLGARRAGRLGTGLLCLDPAMLAPYRDGLAEAGDPIAPRLGGLAHMVLADDPEAAWPRIAPHLDYQRQSYRDAALRGNSQAQQAASDASPQLQRSARLPRFRVLTAADAVTALREELSGLPVQDLFLWATIAGMPDDLAERHVELVGSVLAPGLAATG
jgi:alkanesulfonate monooxygenase SsuD/methylene tetrahydromethanopterin reductase-like flavin-dependent oxidoreductase (luciferase family)